MFTKSRALHTTPAVYLLRGLSDAVSKALGLWGKTLDEQRNRRGDIVIARSGTRKLVLSPAEACAELAKGEFRLSGWRGFTDEFESCLCSPRSTLIASIVMIC